MNRDVLIRIVKPYPVARNHIYTGRVIGYDGRFVMVDGCVLHFGRPSVDDPTGGLTTSSRAIRWVALQRIEYIRELPEGTDPFAPEKLRVATDGSFDYGALERPDLLLD
ncbi:MAG: hypothetical protein ACYTFD_11525 [Planctomycetota bacterium]